jgi:hypothetical protein
VKKFWMGPRPKKCDVCKKPLEREFVDGKLIVGPWATMCSRCAELNGEGLGPGKGQMYSLETLEKIGG